MANSTAENLNKIKQMFTELIAVVDRQRDLAIDSLEGAPLDRQDIIVRYWESVEQSMSEILDGLDEQFCLAMERIKRGEEIDKNALREFFAKLFGTRPLAEMFSKHMLRYCIVGQIEK